MTVPTTKNTITYTGNGVTKPFSFPYLFYSSDDISVKINGSSTGAWSATGAGSESGGIITFSTAPANGDLIVIQRIVSYVQETDLENFDGNPADVTEKQFDLCVMQSQQIAEQIGRAILAPIGTDLTTNTIKGTVSATRRVLTISTEGPSSDTLGSLDLSIDVALTAEASGDILTYDGTSWVNTSQIDGSQIEDNAITLAKMAGGTDGNLITYNASGDPAHVATGDAGQVLMSNGAGAAPTFQDLTASMLQNAGYVTGRYYHGGFYRRASSSTFTPSANNLFGMPFAVGAEETFTRIELTTTATAGDVRFGIYNMEGGIPTTLVADLGEVATASTTSLTISQTLTPGIYMLAVNFSSTPTVHIPEDVAYSLVNQVIGAVSSNAGNGLCVKGTHTYGALPATFPSIAYQTVAESIAVWMRKV